MTTAPRPAVDVSVVMAVKNGARFIDQALDSLEVSTVEPREVLVIDAASGDGARDLVRKRPWATLVTQRSQGIAGAYNEAIGLAQRADAVGASLSPRDDVWTPAKLERHVREMKARPELQFTVSLVQHFLERGATPPAGFRRTTLLDGPGSQEC